MEDDGSLRQILRDLATRRAPQAGEQFLRLYAGAIVNVIRQFEQEEDAVEDCFLHVCAQLFQNQFHKLRQFDLRGAARFSTWLYAVVRNLCLDRRRQEVGRDRIFHSLDGLDALDQAIFSRVYQKGESEEEALSTLQADFPHLQCKRVAQGVERIERQLSSRQRWMLALRHPRLVSLKVDPDDELPSGDAPDDHPDPEAEAIARESLHSLGRALAQVSPSDRVLLRLRFEQELTLQQLARVLGFDNAQAVDRRMRAVLQQLRELLSREGKPQRMSV